MTLALLITAVGGAWAQEAEYVDYHIGVNFDESYDPNHAHFMCVIMNPMNPWAEIKGTLDLSVDDVSKGSFNVAGENFTGWIDPLGVGNHTWSAVFHPEGGGDFSANGAFTIDKAYTQIAYNGSTSIDLGVGESTELQVSIFPDGAFELSYSSTDASVASITKKEIIGNSYFFIIQANAAGTATMTFSFAGNDNYQAAEEKTITVTVLPPAEPTIDVTLNDDKTEATMESMPTYDVNFNYELVRDMAVSMTTKIGDGNDGYRIRLKKSEQNPGKYEPAEMTAQQMKALVKVHDAIENQDLTFGVLDANCIVNIYAANENNEATGDPIAFADLTPGRYIAKAVAATGSAYEGETGMSNIFVLFEGYEVVVPAKEFITYYKDEPLYVEDEAAVLYTVSSVNGDKAVLSDKSDAMPSNTPMLVYNNSNETKVILLIPCNEPDMAITVAPEFKGTLTGTTIPASNATTDNYAFNGKQFVWVMNEIAIGANKAYLSIPKTNGNPKNIRLYRGNGETTGIDNLNANDNLNDNEATWYDLNGRRLQGKPSLKGVYIKNGKKVVVK